MLRIKGLQLEIISVVESQDSHREIQIMGSGMHRDFCWHSLECFEKICHSCKLPNFAEMFDAPVSMQTPKNVKHRFRLARYPRKPLFVPASQPSTCIHCQSQAMTTPALRDASVRTLDSTATPK
jgi:hypothetical protein